MVATLEKEKRSTVVPDELTRRALHSFVANILGRQKGNVLKIVLYGSMARGEAHADSDIDVFLLLREKHPYDRSVVESALDADEACDFETYIAPLDMSLEDYADAKKIGLPVVENIERDGVTLYESRPGK